MKRSGYEGREVEVVFAGVSATDFFSERDENIAAVTAAPEAAEMPAMIAREVFDMSSVWLIKSQVGRNPRSFEGLTPDYERCRQS